MKHIYVIIENPQNAVTHAKKDLKKLLIKKRILVQLEIQIYQLLKRIMVMYSSQIIIQFIETQELKKNSRSEYNISTSQFSSNEPYRDVVAQPKQIGIKNVLKNVSQIA
ncbi:unnamed protein product (macronuclear) [Paramecium tetraurelia]|uniref:Uncharacterized protein n=1 Tax=Paramecium tetraurelia TaxID=5888 RepID=A0CKS7_PARTE|nr:uncharacterized protein GSPATT00007940001 [Paramecium tetraurelia]CAK71394.1 unnamed protein product [Paramecium tetraurelia]|eukprot:XP_001438791.1 hypothetical protein (macronuclear) [Paramecium tetraurelia strain d4-2]